MISPKTVEAMNKQATAEFYSAYLYLQMAAYFESMNLPGYANWMRVQRLEEQVHGMKFFDHMVERGAAVKLQAIDMPPAKWASPLAVFEAAYKHEVKVTGMIDDLVNLAQAEKDHASDAFLQWFVTEQVEEENSTSTIVGKLLLIGKDSAGLFMLDRELATRVFVPPPQTGVGAPAAAVGA
jgi:ferritin